MAVINSKTVTKNEYGWARFYMCDVLRDLEAANICRLNDL